MQHPQTVLPRAWADMTQEVQDRQAMVLFEAAATRMTNRPHSCTYCAHRQPPLHLSALALEA